MRKVGLVGALLGALAWGGAALAAGSSEGQDMTKDTTGPATQDQGNFGPSRAKNGDVKNDTGVFLQDPTGRSGTPQLPGQAQAGSVGEQAGGASPGVPPSVARGQPKLGSPGRKSPPPPHTGGSGAPPQPLMPH